MNESRLLLLRHAETSAPDRFHGAESDIGLGERGRLQAAAVARVLAAEAPTAIYSSAMRRAVDTATPIAEACGLGLNIVPELHERKMGPLSGKSRVEGLAGYEDTKARWMAGELSATHPGGESYAEIQRRVGSAFSQIVHARVGKTTVVVAHGVVIRVLLCTLLDGNGPADFDKYRIDNVALNDLRGVHGVWTAAALNRRVAVDAGDDIFAW